MASPEANPRLAAARCLLAVDQGRTLADVAPDPAEFDDPRDAGLARALVFGVLRQGPLLEARLASYLKKPLKARDRDLYWLLLCGLFQLGWMRLPAYAAIHATVDLTRSLGKGWARGLVNGILRRYQRDGLPTDAPASAAEHQRAAHPRWLYRALAEAWPDELASIVAANNSEAPLWLRVNRRLGSRDSYRERLREFGLAAETSPWADEALKLERSVDVTTLPGFEAGEVSVQDAAAQLAAALLDPQPGQRVLDACAAPGGKTAHLLERTPELDLTALELEPRRLERIQENLQRLGLPRIAVVEGDALDPQAWWDGEGFDRILLDAPCSATGVIRRHPDIKRLRRADDLPTLARTQRCMLEALWPLLRPGGRLLYATCSILPQENSEVLEDFLETTADARGVPLDASWGRPSGPGRQLLPGEAEMDGFYYGLLQKEPAAGG